MAARVMLLGPVRVTGTDGRGAVAVVGRRTQLCLAALASNASQVVSREQLADVIWDGEPPASWGAALRNVLTRVRCSLERAGNIAVCTRGNGYQLVLADGAAVDLALLEAAADGADAAERLGRSRQTLRLVEPHLRDLRPALDGVSGEWADGLRRHVDALRIRLSLLAGDAALTVGDPTRAERHARHAVAADPIDEAARRLLMRALGAQGNRAGALATYHDGRRVLRAELGVDPAPATESLAAALSKSGAAGRDGRPGPQMTAAVNRLLHVHRQTPFVGRRAILSTLAQQLRSAGDGEVRLLAVRGEPGAGKTRLAAELAATAHELGMAVLYGRAGDRWDVAYDVFSEAIGDWLSGVDAHVARATLGERDAAVLAGVVPSLSAIPHQRRPHEPADAHVHHVSRAIAAALAWAAGGQGALLVLDDMQWAAAPTREVLASLATRLARCPLAVLVLHHPDADPLGGIDAKQVTRLSLGPLSLANVVALADSSGASAAADAEQVWRDSGGNALLAVELLRAGPTGHPDDAARLDVVVRHRLARLPSVVAGVARVAAVAGESFDPQVVAAASDVDSNAANEALAVAQREGLIQAATYPPGWLAFRHGLMRTGLLATVGDAERRRLNQRVGEALESATQTTPVRLARHFQEASDVHGWRRGLTYGLAATRTADEAGVYDDAAACAERTLALLAAAGDPEPAARLELTILRGGALRAMGDPRGLELLLASFEQARNAGDPIAMAEAAIATCRDGSGTDEAFLGDELLEMHREALSALPTGDIRRRSRLLGQMAAGLTWRRAPSEGRAAAAEAVALAAELGDPATVMPVLSGARRALTGLGDLDAQRRIEGRLDALARAVDDPRGAALAALWRFDTDVQSGRGKRLEATLATAQDHVQFLSASSYHHHLAYSRASLGLLRGDHDAAEILIEHAARLATSRGIAPEMVTAIRLAQLTGLRNEQGRTNEIGAEILDFFGPAGLPQWQSMVALAHWAAGRLDAAAEAADDFLGELDRTGPSMTATVGLAALTAGPIAALGEAGRADRLYALLRPYAGQGGYMAVFTGPVDHALGLLADVTGDTVAARLHFRNAAAFARRLGAPRWVEACHRAASAPRRADPAAPAS